MTKKRQTENPRISRTRSRALEATLELAGERGLHACTFDAISERSGIARSTLYRHWNNHSELVMDALKSQETERIASDTGNLRDDMLSAMLGLTYALENTTWGTILPQMVGVASTDPDMRAIQKQYVKNHQDLDIQSIERAKERGEIAESIDSSHAAMLFSAPIFYRHLVSYQPFDAKWVTAHIDRVMALLLSV